METYNPFLRFLLLLTITAQWYLSTKASKNCTYELPDCADHGNCQRTLVCVHGNCDSTGQCLCDPCWKGRHCDEYVDTYLPQFPTAEESVIVTDIWTVVPLFMANAEDEDGKSTCILKTYCTCNTIRYTITSDHPIFMIDPVTGDVFFKNITDVESGWNYTAVIGAHSMTSDRFVKEKPDSTMQVTFVIQISDLDKNFTYQEDQFNLKKEEYAFDFQDDNSIDEFDEEMEQDEEENLNAHDRVKRAAPKKLDVQFDTTFDLILIGGDPSNMKAGNRLDYKLVIGVPAVKKMDVHAEVFTKETLNGNYTPTFAVFNVSSTISENLQGKEPKVRMILNPDIPTLYDHSIINFGKITNKGKDTSEIVLYFSVAMVRNRATVFKQKHYVTVGIEYSKELYVWVGQSDLIPLDSPDNLDVTGVVSPSSLTFPLDSAGIFILDAYLAVHSEWITVEVRVPQNHTQVVSVGNLGVLNFAEHYAVVPNVTYHYNTTLNGSDDKVWYHTAVLPLGLMTNVGPFNQKPRDDKNRIQLTYAIYAANNEEYVDEEIDIEVVVLVGEEKAWSTNAPVILDPRKAKVKTELIFVLGDAYPPTVASPGDMVSYFFQVNFTKPGFRELGLSFESEIVNGTHRLEPCSARMLKTPVSFNLPYLSPRFVDSEFTKNKYYFKFDRIHVTEQREPSMYNDTAMIIEVVVKVSSEANFGKDSVEPTIAVFMGEEKKKRKSKNLSFSLVPNNKTASPNVNVVSAVDWTKLYDGGAVRLNISLLVPPSVGYSQVIQEVWLEWQKELPPARLCLVELGYVGANVPCLRKSQDDVNKNFTFYEDKTGDMRADSSRMALGDVGALPIQGDNTAILTVVAGLPQGSEFKDGALYRVLGGMNINSSIVWAMESNVTASTADPPQLPVEKKPIVFGIWNGTGKIIPGQMADLRVLIQTAPLSIGRYQVTVTALGTQISICGIRVKRVGRSLPCGTEGVAPKYARHSDPLAGNQKGMLLFNALSNVGNVPQNSKPIEDENTVVISASLRLSPVAISGQQVSWEVDFGSDKLSGVLNMELVDGDLDMNSADVLPLASAFKPLYPNKAVAIGAPIVVVTEVQMIADTVAPMTFHVRNPDSPTRKIVYDTCLGGLSFRGKNYPCFSPLQVKTNISYSQYSKKYRDAAAYDMGLVCNTFVDEINVEENKVKVKTAIIPKLDAGLNIGSTFSVTGTVLVGENTTYSTTHWNFTISEQPDQMETGVPPGIKRVVEQAVPLQLRERKWIPFNVTLPVDNFVKVIVQVNAPVIDKRAILTVHGVRLKSVGPNIPCFHSYLPPQIEPTPTVYTSQIDSVRAEIGYFTNLGLTKVLNSKDEGDDDITFEVQVEMTDHPATENDAIFNMTFGAEVGSSVVVVKQPVSVSRTGTEKPLLQAKVKMQKVGVLYHGQTVDVTITIKHQNESNAEPVDATMRFFLPPFISVRSSDCTKNCDAQPPHFDKKSGGFDIVFPNYLFPDEVTVKVVLMADLPQHGKRLGEQMKAVVPYRLLCRQTFHETPIPNPKSATTILNCGQMSYVELEVADKECDQSLEITDRKKIEDCQITASSAANKEHAPYEGRSIDTTKKKSNAGPPSNGWYPALRLGFDKPWLQIDMLQKTRVSKVYFQKVTKTRSVTKFSLSYSDTGITWQALGKVVKVIYKEGSRSGLGILGSYVEARYFRVIIEEAEPTNLDEYYIGVKIDMTGCPLEEKSATSVCGPDKTYYADDEENLGRHFSVDTAHDIIYFCDFDGNSTKNLRCFSSSNGGAQWKRLGRNTGKILGYDTVTKRVFLVDKKKKSYMASKDGYKFVLATTAEVNSIIKKKTFVPSTFVPDLCRSDIKPNLKLGKWEATFDGLLYAGNKKPKVKWSNCCAA